MRAYKVELAKWKQGKQDTPEPRPPKLARYLVEGTTVEAISEVLRDDDDGRMWAPAGKVLCRQDEMSEWLASFDRYRSGGSGGADRGAYLRLYNGGRHSVDRIGRGSFVVPNWSVCFLGGIQPGPLQKVAKEAHEDGLLQRFMLIVPGPQQTGIDRAPNVEAIDRYDRIIATLSSLRPPKKDGGDIPQHVVFHADAQKHREYTDSLARVMAAMPDTSVPPSVFGTPD